MQQRIIDIITIQDFRDKFPRFSPPYLNVWKSGTVYYKGQIVYYNGLFYECIVVSTDNAPDVAESWRQVEQNVLNFTQDSDIIEAFNEAWINFNQGLFENIEVAKQVFLFLVAHYLTMDFNIALGMNNVGFVTSKSVGSVSQGYAIPPWITKYPGLSPYMTTGYGIKYASLIRPYMIGNIMLVKGRITDA